MTRPLRVEYDGAWYHVMNRGLAHNSIFLNDNHRQIFLDLLQEIHERYSSMIHAYCLMDNHYHLLMQTPLGNLSRIMRHLDGVYTQRYNRNVKRDGPLFRGRFKAILVEADAYLLEISRYIHLNPVKAKFVTKAEDFKWSSYSFYLYDTRPFWLNTEYVLGYFKNASLKYKEFVEKCDINEIDEIQNELNDPILGANNFIKLVAEKYLKEEHKIKEIPQHKFLIQSNIKRIEIGVIVSLVEAFYCKISENYYKNNFAHRKVVVMYLAEILGSYSLTQISQFMNVTVSRVSKARKKLQQQMQENSTLKKEVEEICRFIISESKVKT